MKESHGEGSASHTGPEPCVDGREAGGEALEGAQAGLVLSRESKWNQGADAVHLAGRQHRPRRKGEARMDPARSETCGMSGNSWHGTWEIPRVAVAGWGGRPHGEP